MIILVFSTMFLISLILLLLSSNFIESEKSNFSSDIAFECGFEPFFFPRVPFSIHFFTITIVFLVFDLEIVFLLPILFVKMSSIKIIQMILIVLILFLGLLVEWYDSSLEWQI